MKELNGVELREVVGGNPIFEYFVGKLIDFVCDAYVKGDVARNYEKLGDYAEIAALQYN